MLNELKKSLAACFLALLFFILVAFLPCVALAQQPSPPTYDELSGRLSAALAQLQTLSAVAIDREGKLTDAIKKTADACKPEEKK